MKQNRIITSTSRLTPYPNRSGDSGVVAYAAAADAITIRFQDGGTYLYTYNSTGRKQIEDMKRLAKTGDGLATYINIHVRDAYARKLS